MSFKYVILLIRIQKSEKCCLKCSKFGYFSQNLDFLQIMQVKIFSLKMKQEGGIWSSGNSVW